MQGEINKRNTQALGTIRCPAGAGCRAIHLGCKGCLESESLRASSRVNIICTQGADEQK